MKRILHLLIIWGVFVALFAVAKPVFMLYAGAVGQGAEAMDFLEVIWYGLPLDVCVAACATLPFAVLSPFQRLSQRLSLPLALCLAALFSLALVADTCLYEFWDIKLDATVLAYLDSPRGVTSSVSTLFLLGITAAWASLTAAVSLLLRWPLRQMAQPLGPLTPQQRGNLCGAYLLLAAFLGLCIYGIHRPWASEEEDEPLSVATVYYSPRQLFNHSAVNPVFSFLTSVGDRARGISPDAFMTDTEADSIFSTLGYNTQSIIAPADSLLRSDFCRTVGQKGGGRIILIIMEGFGGTLVSEVCGKSAEITPCLNRLCREGVFFTQCYANSFRTDRGVLCTLSGYPSFPDISVMRQSGLVATLPGIAASLKPTMGGTDFLYGGDKDFTRMADYLRATGYDHVWGDTDFPDSLRKTHDWGVTDGPTFAQLPSLRAPFVTFLTLASHEPWEVPFTGMKKKGRVANAFAYADSCLGRFIEAYRRTPEWDRTLIIITADHGIAWPDGLSEADADRWHIPLVWTGGAIRSPRRIDRICNQSDLAATLLGQLGIDHTAYRFSRDVMSQSYTVPCAQHSWAEGIGFIDATGYTTIDLHTLRPLSDHPAPKGPCIGLREEVIEQQKKAREMKAKAFLQTAYRDLERR